MSRHLKKIFSVLFAILIGASIIFFAWKGGVSTYKKDVAEENSNTWKDTLRVVPQISPLKTLGFSGGGVATSTNNATTTTGIIARDLLVEYALTQTGAASTTLSDTEIGGIAQTLAERARSASPVKEYTEKDIVVVPASDSASQTYQKKVSQAFVVFEKEHSVNELSLVFQFTQKGDASVLAPISISLSSYKKLVKTLLEIPTPTSFVPFHLLLIKTYATLLSGTEDMAQTIADPVRGMNGLATYRAGLELVSQINTLLRAQ